MLSFTTKHIENKNILNWKQNNVKMLFVDWKSKRASVANIQKTSKNLVKKKMMPNIE